MCGSAEADSGGGGVQCDTFYDSEAKLSLVVALSCLVWYLWYSLRSAGWSQALPGDSALTKMDGVVAQQVECEEVATVDDAVAQEEAQVVEKRVCLENQFFDGEPAGVAHARAHAHAHARARARAHARAYVRRMHVPRCR